MFKQTTNSPSLQIYSQSIQLHPSYVPVIQKLIELKKFSKQILHIFFQFKQKTTNDINKSIGRISSLIQRLIAANQQQKQQLDVVKSSNQSMKKQVVQLRQMIEQFVKSYNSEIQAKDAQIRQLKLQLGVQNQQKATNNIPYIKYNEQQDRRKSLQIIQQVSEYTASCAHSIRQISIPNSAKDSQIPVASNLSNLTQTQDQWVEQDKINKSKSFLKFFRKNMDQSVLLNQEYTQIHNQSKSQSHKNSIEDLHLGDTDKINLPKSIKSPKHMQILKKQPKRFSTQQDKQNNNCIQLKTTPHRRNHSHSESQQKQKSQCKSQKNSRSHSKAGSKQKIKLASKIVDQINHIGLRPSRKPSVNVRPSVHLGGKIYLKKLAKEIRTALQDYKAWEGVKNKQVKYQGQRKSGLRWGKGRLLYDNGFQYEGNFIQNYKHGIGTVSLNGIIFYQGQWSLDQISGQGYIKSLKNFSESCPKYLQEASYCGQLLQNKLHGMGTLFINSTQKFVSKFVHGVPVGQFTYYSHAQIEFGSWF